ncbi:MAG: type II secretion system protein GspL [Lautropia sp.]
MATPQLKRNQAIVWLPPRSVGERAFGTEPTLLVHVGGEPNPLARRASLDALGQVRQVRLVADPRDVNLIEVVVPPLAGAKLRQALPNLVEEYLLQDPAKCLIVPGPLTEGGKRLIAVIDRDWVEFVVGAFDRRNIRVEAWWPAQLVLPLAPTDWSLAALHGALTLRTGALHGIGWHGGGDAQARAEAVVALLETAGARVEAPEQLIAFLEDESWEGPVRRGAAHLGIDVEFARLPLLSGAPIDLMTGRASGLSAAIAQFDWRIWRLPAALGAACVVAALAGLNLHWAMQASEKRAIRSAMNAKFRAAFPGVQQIVDPVLQMKRNVAVLRAQSGRAGPDDFLPLLASFSQAIGPQGQQGLAALEFRDGKLKVRFSQEAVARPALREDLRKASAQRGLRLQFDNERDPTAVVSVQSG